MSRGNSEEVEGRNPGSQSSFEIEEAQASVQSASWARSLPDIDPEELHAREDRALLQPERVGEGWTVAIPSINRAEIEHELPQENPQTASSSQEVPHITTHAEWAMFWIVMMAGLGFFGLIVSSMIEKSPEKATGALATFFGILITLFLSPRIETPWMKDTIWYLCVIMGITMTIYGLFLGFTSSAKDDKGTGTIGGQALGNDTDGLQANNSDALGGRALGSDTETPP